MRAVHRYYRYHYNKLLKMRHYDETLAPSIDKLHYCYESLSKQKMTKSMQNLDAYKGSYQQNVNNIDHIELNTTKDVLDFDRNFLKHLKTSIESQKQQIFQSGLKSRWTGMRDDYLTQKDLAMRAPEASQNWVPVWPQLDQDYGDNFDGTQPRESPKYLDLGKERAYSDLEICSLRKYKGERQMYRQLRVDMVQKVFDFYVYEESEQGLNMWNRDSQRFNLQKFKMGKFAITEKDLELDEDDDEKE